MTSESFAENILRHLQARGYRPQPASEIAAAMGIAETEQGSFHDACKALMKTGRVVMGTGSTLLLPQPASQIVGEFRANPKGFGFIVPSTPNAHGDLYVPPEATGGAITGDTVRARVTKRGKRGSKLLYEARVLEVIQRGRNRFVGELARNGSRWAVIPDGNVLHAPILVSDPGAKSTRAGDQVVVELVEYPTPNRPARGVIVRVLGPHGDPGVDAASIIEHYQLPTEFDDESLREAAAAVERFDAGGVPEDREDLTGMTVITIDPIDARDFDDAISLAPLSDGRIELGVHIADVSHFVREGGAIDTQARERGNSVYFPRHVIPMLPEVLSNGVCSLQERQLRLTKSVFLTYNDRGRVLDARFSNSMIRSAKRLTYEQASAILEGKHGRTSKRVIAILQEADRLARRIRERRLEEGMLVLDLPDIELIHDDDGRVVDVRPEDQSFSHTVIEMFMVEANEAVARRLTELNVPFLRRIHAPCDTNDGSLRRFLRILGHDIPAAPARRDLQALLDGVRDRPEAFAVHLAVLRSMSQAEYSPANTGHFALASDNYCHFTSPIRRYPDLTVHRLLDRALRGDFPSDGRTSEAMLTEEKTESLGAHCSDTERRAESAERELKLVLLLRLLSHHVGEEFEGIVTGIANVGVFVQLRKYLIDGLLRFEGLLDDWWEIDPSRGAVQGQRSGRRLVVGDRLKVTIARVHVPTRQLNLSLLDASYQPRKSTQGSRKRGRQARGATTRKGHRSTGRALKGRNRKRRR